jgi:hypothetical protein
MAPNQSSAPSEFYVRRLPDAQRPQLGQLLLVLILLTQLTQLT